MAARFFFLLLLLLPFTARAEGETTLLLEVWINGRTNHNVIETTQGSEGMLIYTTALAKAGIKFTPEEIRQDGFIATNSLPGVKMDYNSSEQKLEITAGADRLTPQVFELEKSGRDDHTRAATGFLGQYDLVGTVDNFGDVSQNTTTGAVLGGTIFTPSGNFSANGLAEHQRNSNRVVRFDTSYQRDDPDSLRRFVAGDAISGSQSWSRSVRFGGIQIATDFALRPDLTTMPLPAFFGQTSVPANIDVFVNSARVFEGNVDAGPFQINNLPVITGSGEANIVVRNALGQETVVTLPFYASNAMLRPGLSSYALDAGFLRTGYGQKSFGYEDAMLAGTYSHGYKRWLTLETHAEAASGVQLAGGGVVFSVDPIGIIHFASSVSHNNDFTEQGFGTLQSFAFESETQPVGFFGTINIARGNYTDIATIGGTAPPKLQMQIGSHATLGEYGALAGSLVGVQREHEDTTKLATASYTRSIGGNWNFGATGFYDYTHSETVVQGFLTYTLGNGLIADSNAYGGTHSHGQQVGLTKPVNPDGGLGYRVSAARGDNDSREASATWVGSHGTVDGAFAVRSGQEAARLTASGGLVVMGDEIFATKRPDGSVALVKTGAPGTTVYYENREIAKAGDDGRALVTGLVPFTANRISIDPNHYKLSSLIEQADKTVSPGRQSGVVVDFTPRDQSPAILILQLQDGNFPAAGAQVALQGSTEPLVIGHRGEVFLADMQTPVYGTVTNGNSICSFSAAPPTTHPADIPRIGPLLCKSGQAMQ